MSPVSRVSFSSLLQASRVDFIASRERPCRHLPGDHRIRARRNRLGIYKIGYNSEYRDFWGTSECVPFSTVYHFQKKRDTLENGIHLRVMSRFF